MGTWTLERKPDLDFSIFWTRRNPITWLIDQFFVAYRTHSHSPLGAATNPLPDLWHLVLLHIALQ
jgi:hypothetical protein